MACDPLHPVACAAGQVAGTVVGSVANAAGASLGNSFADAMRDGASWVITTTIGWWIQVPSLDLTTSPASQVRADVWWLSLIVAAAGMIWQGIRMTLSRRVDPLIDVGRGLVTLALWAGVGIIGPNLALKAGDAFSSWVLDQAASGQVAARLVALAGLQDINSAGAVIVLGLIVMVAGLVQAVLMMFREGAVVVLAGVLVLAAAGNITAYGRPWLMKVLGWMLALITYKPVAALVYAVALQMTGTGTDPRTVLIGLAMMVMSVVALPALMKFFTWATGSTGGGGGMAGLIGLSAAGIQAAGALRSRGAGGSGAADSGAGGGGAGAAHAAGLRHDLGPAVSAPTAASGAAMTASPAAGAASTGAAASTASTAGVAAGAATGGAATVAIAAGQVATGAVKTASAQATGAMGTSTTAREDSA